MLMAEGLRDILSVDTETTSKLCLGYTFNTTSTGCTYPFLGKVRGMLTKLPGFTFSSYKEIAFFSITLIPDYQYY
jgi:hypothetical protein